MRYKIIVIIMAMILLNGLNNSRELNDLAIVSAIGIDKVENGNFKVSAIVLNPEKQDSGSSSSSASNKMIVYEREAPSVQEAIRNMILESPKRLYLAHMELLLVSEEVAKKDLVNALDFFIRDNEGSNDFLFVISKGTSPSQTLQVKTQAEEIPTENIVKSIKASNKYVGITTNNLLDDTLENLLEEGEEVVMPSIVVVKSDKNEKDESESSGQENSGTTGGEQEQGSSNSSTQEDEKILVDTLAYFKDNEFKGYMTKEESMAYTILRNKFKGGVIQIDKEDRLVAEFVQCKANLTPKYENGQYIMDIEVKGICNIAETGKKLGNVDYKSIEEYEKLISQELYTYIKQYVDKCTNEYDSDLMGYGKIFREKLNKEYIKVKDVFYKEIFKNIKTNINVNIEFPNDGGINKKW